MKRCRHRHDVWWLTDYPDLKRVMWCPRCGATRIFYTDSGWTRWNRPGAEGEGE